MNLNQTSIKSFFHFSQLSGIFPGERERERGEKGDFLGVLSVVGVYFVWKVIFFFFIFFFWFGYGF